MMETGQEDDGVLMGDDPGMTEGQYEEPGESVSAEELEREEQYLRNLMAEEGMEEMMDPTFDTDKVKQPNNVDNDANKNIDPEDYYKLDEH